MPFHNYGKMTTEDVYSIIAYIRILKPIENIVPERRIDFPMNFIINTISTVATPSAYIPDTSQVLEYGAGVFNAAACGECHTKQDKGQQIADMELARWIRIPVR